MRIVVIEKYADVVTLLRKGRRDEYDASVWGGAGSVESYVYLDACLQYSPDCPSTADEFVSYK